MTLFGNSYKNNVRNIHFNFFFVQILKICINTVYLFGPSIKKKREVRKPDIRENVPRQKAFKLILRQ